MTSTTDQQLFIVETKEPFESMEIQFVPYELNSNRKADIRDIKVVGRNNPLQQYTGGDETLSFVIEMYGDNTMVLNRINWLKSLTHNDGYGGSFRSVKLVMGELFKYDIWNITSVQTNMNHLDRNLGWGPQRASVTISLKLDPKTNKYIQDVRNGR